MPCKLSRAMGRPHRRCRRANLSTWAFEHSHLTRAPIFAIPAGNLCPAASIHGRGPPESMGTRPRRWISPFTGATHLTTWDFRRSGPGQVLRKDYTDSPHETNGSGDPGGSLRGRCHQVRARGAISGPARAAGCDSDGLGRSAVRTCYGRTAWTPHMKVMVRATQLAHSGPKTVQSGHLESIPSLPDYGGVTLHGESTPLELHVRQ